MNERTGDGGEGVVRRSAPGRVWRLTRKELSEILRDRRTIVTLVAMPLLLYPLLSVAFQQFFLASYLSPDRGPAFHLGFPSGEEARLLLHRLEQGERELQRRRAVDAANPEARKNAEDKGPAKTVRPPKVESFIGESERLEESLREGKIDLLVRIPGAAKVVRPGGPGAGLDLQGRDWGFRAEVAYRERSPAARVALDYVEQRLAAADAVDLRRRLGMPGTPPTAVLQLARAPVTEEADDTVVSLASLVPLILILMTITGAVYPAIDLTAGERERGTLEILMAAPVPRFELLTAKYFSVLTVAVLTALVNLLGMAITLQLSGLGRVIVPAGLSFGLLVQLFLLLLLFGAFFSAVLLGITSFARSFKEAQAYLIPLMLASLAPGVLAMMPGLQLTGFLAVVPLVNIVLMARDLFNEGIDPAMAFVAVSTTLLYALAALALAARVFGAESVLYSEQSAWSDLLRRADEPRDAPGLAAALWCLALTVPLHFVLMGSLQQLGLPPAALVVLAGLASVVQYVAIPAAAAYLGRVRWTTGFGLKAPRAGAVAAGVLLGLSLWPVVLSITGLVTSIQERHEEVLARLREAQRGLEPLMLVAMVVAALTEELFFRGFLFRALRERSGPVVTIGATALLFGLAHVFIGGALGIERLLPSTLLGLVLGWVCWVSRSVIPGMALHALHNALLIVIQQQGWVTGDEVPAPLLLGGVAGTAVAMLVLWFSGKPRQAG